jgi:hypothetical protein
MPVYSFFCDQEHESEWVGSHKERPTQIQCKACTATAAFTPTISKRGNSETMNYSTVGPTLSIHDFCCDACGEVFDQLIDTQAGESVSAGTECKCGGHAHWIPVANIDRDSDRYPRFDRGLGLMLTSKAHRADVCANPAKYGIKTKSGKLTPVDGDWDSEKYSAERKRKEDADLKGYAEYVHKLDYHPAFKDYRRARDQGRI